MKMDKIFKDILLYGGYFYLSDWNMIRVSGNDCENFLQGQTTNDITKLILGESQISVRLDSNGRIKSYFYIKRNLNNFIIIVPKVLVKETISSFEKYIIMDDVELRQLELNLTLIMGAPSFKFLKWMNFEEENVVKINFMGIPSIILIGDQENINLENNSINSIDDKTIEHLRILSGYPKWGLDIDSSTLINESFLNEIAVSYKKGCFLGQETAAKIQSRRGPAYFPVFLVNEYSESTLIEFRESFRNEIYLRIKDEFYIEDVKAGYVLGMTQSEGCEIVLVALLRQFRVENQCHVVKFKGSEFSFSGRVHYIPFWRQNLDKTGSENLALLMYEEALELFTHQDNTERAIGLLEQVVDIDPLFADAYEALGVLLGRLERFDEAIYWLKKLVNIDPKSIMAHTNLSIFYMKLGKIQEAEDEKALATIKSFDTYAEESERKKSEVVKLKEKNQELARREDLFRQILEIDPDDYLANFGLGEIYLERNQRQNAIMSFEKVLKENIKYSVAYLGLGKALELEEKWDDAIKIYKKGIQIAASQGELMPANEMQKRLDNLITIN